MEKIKSVQSHILKMGRRAWLPLAALLSIVGMTTPKATCAPASGASVMLTDPSGAEVEVIAVGDEHSRHYVYAKTGKPVEWLPRVSQHIGVRQLDKSILTASAKPIVKDLQHGIGSQDLRKAESGRIVYSSSPKDESGQSESKFLVILVDFPDRRFTTTNPHQAFQEVMNGDEMPVRGSYGSAARYFSEQSGGIFQPHFDVVGPITLGHPAAYYASVGVDDSPTANVLKEACEQLDASLDFNQYDLDGDGICDNIYIFFSGKGQADGGGSTSIWPHSARLDLDWGVELSVDGVRISNYACSAELNGSSRFSGIGTFCHEFCHVLGLPDLYYTGVPHPQYFSLMASGNYNGDGFYPPNLSAYERYALGWLSPEELTNSDWYTLAPMADGGDVHRVSTEADNEYFLLENRQKKGWDTHLPGRGLLIWHIDYDQEAWDNNIPNADRNHQRVFLVRANNNLNGYPNAGAPFPGSSNVDTFDATTTPAFVSWDGTPVNCALSTISQTPSGQITFRAETTQASITTIQGEPTYRFDPVNPWGGDEANVRIFSIDGREMARGCALPAGLYIVQPSGQQAVKVAIH